MAEAEKPVKADAEPSMPANTTRKVTPEELAIAYSGPAVLTNKFYITMTPTGVRIAFTEVQGEGYQPQFRTAVLLPFQDALALQQLLGRMIGDNTATFSLEDLPPELLAKINAKKT